MGISSSLKKIAFTIASIVVVSSAMASSANAGTKVCVIKASVGFRSWITKGAVLVSVPQTVMVPVSSKVACQEFFDRRITGAADEGLLNKMCISAGYATHYIYTSIPKTSGGEEALEPSTISANVIYRDGETATVIGSIGSVKCAGSIGI